MEKFGEAYKRAAGQLPEYVPDGRSIRDELSCRRMQRRTTDRILARSCAAAAVCVLLWGAGTAVANDYRESIVSPTADGFAVQGAKGRASEKSQGSQGEKLFLEKESSDIGYIEEAIAESREYDSVQKFRQEETVVIALPDLESFKAELKEEYVAVTEGRDVYLSLWGEECSFSMQLFDCREYANYSSATSYGGESCNRRSITTRQGISYMVFDIAQDGKIQSTHAVVSVNGRDLSMDFQGFEEKEIQEILDSVDLTVYFED